MTMLANQLFERAALLLFFAVAAFGLGLVLIRRLGKSLTSEPDLPSMPLAGELPPDAYDALIRQLKKIDPQQSLKGTGAEAGRSPSASAQRETASGVLFVNTAGLVRQANSAACALLGMSPVGMNMTDLFRAATVHLPNEGEGAAITVGPALGAALSGRSTVRELLCDYVAPNGERRVLEVTASPVIAADASPMGATLILNNKTESERECSNRQAGREYFAADRAAADLQEISKGAASGS